MIAFTKRNLKIYFRDRASVLFSLLTVFIIIGLYVLFLGDVWTKDLQAFEGARELMDNWVMAGVLAVTSFTTTMGMLGSMVKDRELKINMDFYISPISRTALTGGYIAGAYIVGLTMTLLAFVAAEIYIVVNGGSFLAAEQIVKVLAMILLTTLMNTTLMVFIVSLFRSQSAFSVASTVFGTMIGFITGIYLPIGMYPEAVQWIIKIFPVSHAAAIFRNLMMEGPMKTAFEGAPAKIAADLKTELGVCYEFGGHTVTQTESLLIIAACIVIFFVLGRLCNSKRNVK
ncbi:MAG: ABC transporter permease [Emergencia timonensis]|uniref:ABC transporter permease n=1 Tax=Emergencia timonensis TaxID=1776384 RepID=UPI00082A7F92|nr:ABC transporter permease [Emergencia timonensis]WNX87549.1 ABC transporter permease [Emergencia timonensis]